MSDPYLGEIRLVPFHWAPPGWLPCHGQALPIQRYQALFALIGFTYGGNNSTIFNLPDLRGRAAVHAGMGPLGVAYAVAESGAPKPHHVATTAAFTPTPAPAELPPHGHAAAAENTAGSLPPQAAVAPVEFDIPPAMPPFLAMNYIICVENGEWPPRP